ncbi:hypothetical protein BS78_K298900, partial [Paspalum vaginatum]
KSNAKATTSTGGPHRTRNYIVQEDLCLCSAFLNVSKDPIVGTNQSSEGYWERIHQYYHAHRTFVSDRNPGSLVHRWTTIREAVQKFCGYKALQDRLDKSGHTEEDRIQAAIKMYRKHNKCKEFNFRHCWEALHEAQKWK